MIRMGPESKRVSRKSEREGDLSPDPRGEGYVNRKAVIDLM